MDAHGADLERWPSRLRAEARAVADTAAGRSELAAARALEALLAESLPPPPLFGLKARILAGVPHAVPGWPEWLASARWRRLAGVATAPLALGFVLGFAWPNEDDALEDAVSGLAFSATLEATLAEVEGTGESGVAEGEDDVD